MRVLLQKVRQAEVMVADLSVAKIGVGLLLLVGVGLEDERTDADFLVRKISQLRVFADAQGVMNLSVLETGADILAVSQFTLMAHLRKGNRPSYSRAARPEIAKPLFDYFVECLTHVIAKPVPTGVFGADMQVSLVNDGPVTIILDSKYDA